jgi:hypothetical protein
MFNNPMLQRLGLNLFKSADKPYCVITLRLKDCWFKDISIGGKGFGVAKSRML